MFQIVSKVCLCFEHLQKNGVSRYSNSIDAFLSFRNCFVSPRFVGLLVMEAVEEEEDGRPGQQGISQVSLLSSSTLHSDPGADTLNCILGYTRTL